MLELSSFQAAIGIITGGILVIGAPIKAMWEFKKCAEKRAEEAELTAHNTEKWCEDKLRQGMASMKHEFESLRDRHLETHTMLENRIFNEMRAIRTEMEAVRESVINTLTLMASINNNNKRLP